MAFMSLEHPDSVLALACVRTRSTEGASYIASGCQDHAVRLYDASSFACVQVLSGHARAVLSLTFCEGLLFSGSSDTTIRVWDLRPRGASGRPSFECLAVLRLGMGSIYSLASWAAPSDTSGAPLKLSLFAGCQDSNVYRLDLELSSPPTSISSGSTGAAAVALRGVAGFTGHQGFVYSCMVRDAPQGTQLLAGSGDGRLRVWTAFPLGGDGGSGGDAAPVASPTPGAVAGDASPSPTVCPIITVPTPDPSSLYAPRAVLVSPSPADVLRTRQASVIADVSPTPHAAVTVYPGSEADGSGSSSGGASFGSGATGRDGSATAPAEAAAPSSPGLPGGCGGVYALAALGRDVYSGSADGCIRVWDADTLVLKYVLTGHEGEVLSLAVSGGEGSGTAAGGHAGAHHGAAAPPSLAPVLASGSADGSIRLWSTRTYSCIQVLRPAPRDAASKSSNSSSAGVAEDPSSPAPRGMILALSSLGPMLFSASNDNTIRVYDTAARLSDADGGSGASSGPGSSYGHHHHHHHHHPLLQQHNSGVTAQHSHYTEPSPAPTTLPRIRPSLPGHLAGAGGFTASPAQHTHATPGPRAPLPSSPAPGWQAQPHHHPHSHHHGQPPSHYHYAPQTGGAMDFSPSHAGPGHSHPHQAGFGGAQPTLDASSLAGSHPGAAASAPSPPSPPSFDLSQQALLSVLRALISIPSVSIDDPPRTRRDVEACWRAARYIADLLGDIGAECRLVQGSPGSNPLVLARLGGWDPGVPAICLHAHYDVQPPGDESKWASPPFTLTGRDGFLYARGATDYKGPLVAMIFAVARYWAATAAAAAEGGVKRPAFVFIVEGEGENGSVGFREAVLQNIDWLSGTRLVLNANNTWIGEATPCLTYGMRGLVKLRVDVEGPSSDLHSGLDGGVAQEPLQELCGLMASLTDSRTGRLAVPGLYEMVAPVTPAELGLYKGLDFDVGAYMEARGLPGIYAATAVPVDAATAAAAAGSGGGSSDSSGCAEPPAKRARLEPPAAASSAAPAAPVDVTTAVLLRRWREPSVTVHGVVCSASNDSIIPRKATGFVSVRTVPNMTSSGTFEAVAAHLRSVFLGRRSANKLTVSMTSHAAWWWGDPSAPHFQAAAAAIEEHWGRPPIFVREGGTVRVTTFLERTLGAPALHFPMGQSSDAPHLPNERIRLLNLVMGARVLQSYFGLLAAQFSAPQAEAGPAPVVVGSAGAQ